MVKTLPAMRETWGRSLGQKDPLEKGMATHSSSFAWRIEQTEEPDCQWGRKGVGLDSATNTFTFMTKAMNFNIEIRVGVGPLVCHLLLVTEEH